MSAIRPGVAARRESFTISVVSRPELSGCAPWMVTFADQRKDHRYYEILDDTLRGDFEYRYFAIVDDKGEIRAIQPFLLVDQDILSALLQAVHLDGWLFRRGGPSRSHRKSARRHRRGNVVERHHRTSEITQRPTRRAEGISCSLSQSASLLRATRLRARAEHADDGARHRV